MTEEEEDKLYMKLQEEEEEVIPQLTMEQVPTTTATTAASLLPLGTLAAACFSPRREARRAAPAPFFSLAPIYGLSL